ncbi:MAG: transposase [Phycisphaerae bacterium]
MGVANHCPGGPALPGSLDSGDTDGFERGRWCAVGLGWPVLSRRWNHLDPSANGYLWTYLCESSKLVLYDFTTSHGRAGPSSFLSGFEGSLLTDGHASYNEVVQRGDLIHAGCWAHARRKFYDARRDDPRRCGPMLS